MCTQTYKFFAFISYRHTDIKAAKRLQRLLEHYHLPAEIQKQVAGVVPEKFKIFRDADELTSGILSDELKKKLDESKFLIVICSPNVVQSKYVGDEIAYFRSLGRAERIIPFIIDGVPGDGENECMHPQLKIGETELLGIDVQAQEDVPAFMRFQKAFIRVVAKMLDLDFGVLWNKRRYEIIRNAILKVGFLLVILGALIYLLSLRQKEMPFDVKINVHETCEPVGLPLSSDGRDTLYIYLSNDDVRKMPIEALGESLDLPNIPGRYKDSGTRIVFKAFGCHTLDTLINLSAEIDLPIRRNPETYGRIRYYVLDNDMVTPVVGALFDFGCVNGTTDENGLLDVLIPLRHQRPGPYPVTITYRGEKRRVAFQPELNPFLDRQEVGTICLE